MQLMTKEIEEKLAKAPLYSKEGQGEDAEVIVKYFNPYGSGTRLITEGQKQLNGDWLLFGMCHLLEWEWGYVLLSQLEKLKAPPFGFGIERDLYATGTVKELKAMLQER